MIAKTKMITLIFMFFVVYKEIIKNVTAYNPLLTYSVRYNNIKFYPNLTGNYTINQNKGQQYINGYMSFNFKETINKISVVFNRCNSEGINCEYFQSWSLTDICPKIKEKNQIWSSLIKSFHPPMECPIQANYRIQNATIDINPITQWYSDATDHQWKITLKLNFDNAYLGGIFVDSSIFGYRKKNNVPLKL